VVKKIYAAAKSTDHILSEAEIFRIINEPGTPNGVRAEGTPD
jgi:hypothetical protein